MGFPETFDTSPGSPFDPTQRSWRRRLILQDTLALLTLLGITAVLSVITYFFFSSFRKHRQVLETRWYERGQQAMRTGHAPDAIEDFRSALSLSSGNRTYELALAQALGASGRTDEAFAYFSTLRDAAPADGLLNLELARLAVRKHDSTQAISFYLDALNGDWLAEGIVHRRKARLELAQYLIFLHQPAQAQKQLLTAEGNALDDPAVMNQIAALLEQANFQTDALTAYKRARQHAAPNSREMLQALLGESHVAESLGRYETANQSLERYLAKVHQVRHPPETAATAEAALDQLQRLSALDPLPSLPPQQRVRRLMLDAAIAHKRYTACLAPLQTVAQNASGVASLPEQWQSYTKLRRIQFINNQHMQNSLESLIEQTEILSNQLCGSPTGDDALLLQLATTPNKTE